MRGEEVSGRHPSLVEDVVSYADVAFPLVVDCKLSDNQVRNHVVRPWKRVYRQEDDAPIPEVDCFYT